MSVFISYAAPDVSLAQRVEARLREERHVVVRDQDRMRFGGNWRDEILPKIDTCDAFVLLWTAAADESRHVHVEILRALEHNRHIVTCLFDETVVPGFIRDVQHFEVQYDLADFGDVLLAITPRAGGDGTAGPADRLEAAKTLLGISRRRFSSFRVLYPEDERPIDDAVPLQLAEGASGDAPAGRDYYISELLGGLEDGSRVVIVGHPGSGKTTTLHLAAHELCAESDGTELPIYLECKEFSPARHTSLAAFAVDAIRQQSTDEIARLVSDIGLGPFGIETILVDGFDELPAGTREDFQNIVDEFINDDEGRKLRLLMTVRTDAFRALEENGEWFRGWRRSRIQPLDRQRIEQFVRQWFETSGDADAFMEEVRDPRLSELAERPFLLALMCLVFERDHQLGANRSDLYRRAVGYLELRRVDQAGERTAHLRGAVLRELALRSLQMGVVEFDRWVAGGVAAAVLARENGSTTFSFESVFSFLDEAAREVGVLQASGAKYSFLHRSFQEYLAAEKLGGLKEGEGVLLEHCRVASWEEPVRLYVGQLKGADRQLAFLRQLWRSNDALTLRSLTELGRGSAAVIKELLAESEPADRVRMLLEVRASLIDSDPRTRRRLAIETAAPLLEAESDSEVLYWAIAMITEVDPDDSTGTLWQTIGKHADRLRTTLLEDPGYKFELVDIAGGEFVMGDDTAQVDIEKPAHPVTVSPFRVGRWQLTNLAYEFITGRKAADRPAYAREDEHPVVDLSWFDAYISATRVGCRLPTEAEWEYAARAGTSTQWSHGDEVAELNEYANHEDNPATGGSPWPVGTGTANPWELFDVHGNVWEWCQDWLAPYPDGPVTDPKGPDQGSQRVRRGGGHSYHARGCRSSFRWGNDPGYHFNDIGVRFAADVTLDKGASDAA